MLMVALIAGCGGGGGGTTTVGGGVGSGGTGSFTVGSVSGFGSIIVNGNIRLDDSGASFRTDDDDQSDDDKGGALNGDDVKLGMIVEVEGGKLTAPSAGQTLSTGTAQVIRIANEIKGPVSNIDDTAGTFTLLGQTVKVNATTVYENVGSLATANAAGNCQYAEVYAFLDTTTFTYNASRVECKSSQPQTYRLFGPASAINSSGLNINGFRVNFGTTPVPAGLANGDRVRVRINPASVLSPSAGTAERITKAGLPGSSLSRNEAEIKGLVTDFMSNSFKVNGIAVVTTGSTVFESSISNGVLVEVKGSLSNGVLTAVKVETESEDDQDAFELELIGTISNRTTTSFTLTAGSRSFNVSYSSGTEGANLVTNGAKVEVKGVAGQDANTLIAERIRTED